jgi:hypothetical protein
MVRATTFPGRRRRLDSPRTHSRRAHRPAPRRRLIALPEAYETSDNGWRELADRIRRGELIHGRLL